MKNIIIWYVVSIILIIWTNYILYQKKEVTKEVIKEVIVQVDTTWTQEKINWLRDANIQLLEQINLLKNQLKCWPRYNCNEVVWFLEWTQIVSWYITLYVLDEIRTWVIGWYWINTEEDILTQYIWPRYILSQADVFGSKKELIQAIK